MSESNFDMSSEKCVPIKVDRVFDSCSDKDCLSDIQVTLESGELPESIRIVKSRCASVSDICINVEAIPFNKGFYSVDLTFTFNLEIIGYERACGTPTTFRGTAFITKNCILYGSESGVKTFFSDGTPSTGSTDECCNTVNLPRAIVSVVEPIVLETKIKECCVPQCEECACRQTRSVVVTLGLFSVVELTRPVTIMVPTVDYTVPKRECCVDNDSPCEIFEKLKFPSEEFSPLTIRDTLQDGDFTGHCGCDTCES